MGPILAIETSGERGGVALLAPDGSILELELEEGLAHGRTLVPAMAELLRRAALVPRELSAVAVSVGPGSYTGLRIGVTAAKALAWAVGLRVVAVSTLEALACDAAGSSGASPSRLVPAIDARRGEVYWALFAREEGRVRRESPDRSSPPGELSKALRPGDFVFGTAVSAYQEELGAGSIQLATSPASPRAATVARLGAELVERGALREPHDLAPEYLRRPEAILRREGKAPLV